MALILKVLRYHQTLYILNIYTHYKQLFDKFKKKK